MRSIPYLLALWLIASCEPTLKQEDLKHLGGYWEIEKVVFPDGSSREYSLSATIDYFEYEDLKGFRKKVQPNLKGTYTTSDDAEFFEIATKKDIFILRYTNELSQWEEVIKSVDEVGLVLVSQDGVTYFYKRFQPISQE